MQPFVTEDQSGLSEGLLGATSILGQALQKRNQRQEGINQMGALANAFQQVNPDAPFNEQISGIQSSLSEAGVNIDPKTLGSYMQLYQKGKEEQQKKKIKVGDLGLLNQTMDRVGKDAPFSKKVDAILGLNIDPKTGVDFISNLYKGELSEQRRAEEKTSAKRYVGEEKKQKQNQLEADYKEQISSLTQKMKDANLNVETDKVEELNQNLIALRKQRVKDRRLLARGETPSLWDINDEDSDESVTPQQGQGGTNDLNSILFN